MADFFEEQEQIDVSLGEDFSYLPSAETQEVIEKLKDREIPMPDGWKIDCSTYSPLQLRGGYSFGIYCYGYYPAGWHEAAITWIIQREKNSAIASQG